MSRLIVRNLPKWIKEERLRNHFNVIGDLTDCSMKYTKDGVFRRFAFIGYRTEAEAKAAKRKFNNTYLDTQKIMVDIARDFGDEKKPRAWSKYSTESSLNEENKRKKKEMDEEMKKRKKENKEKKKKEKTVNPVVQEMLGDLKDDPNFQEFMEVHQNVTVKPVWKDDTNKTETRGDKPAPISDKSALPFDDDTDDDEDQFENQPQIKEEDTDNETEIKRVQQPGVSDLDYLKSKVDSAVLSESGESETDGHKNSKKKKKKKKKKKQDESNSGAEMIELENEIKTENLEEDAENVEKNKKKKHEKKKKKKGEATDDKMEEDLGEKGDNSDEKKDESKGDNNSSNSSKESGTMVEHIHILKVKGLPPNSREKTVRDFFHPIKIVSLKMPTNDEDKSVGIAYAAFKGEEDLTKALGRHKNFIGGKKVFVNKYKVETVEKKVETKPRPWENRTKEGQSEDISETGRLYVRNLSYTCKEEELEQLFSKFGPLVEVHLPIDSLTKKVKGFAFITYMMPEHAVKAYSDMDGTIFQGRMLHVLPGKEKVEEDGASDEKSSFKKLRQQKQRLMAGSSHNWNTLFLGANAVADVMSEKYNTAKSDILDNDLKGSLGVRMALGETQIISETRDFLIKNGVKLDSFSQANAPRSKSVLLVKNLPAGTKVEEIQALFAKHGALGRVVLPPSGVTAIVEYTIQTEAKLAFRRLAYSKVFPNDEIPVEQVSEKIFTSLPKASNKSVRLFKHIPLYLEWAPVEVFTSETPPTDSLAPPPDNQDVETKEEANEDIKTEVKEETVKVEELQDQKKQEEEDQEPGSVLFIKSLSFDTNEDSLKQLFEKSGKVRSALISRKKDLKNPGQMLSLGYGFVEFKYPDGATRAMQKMQHAELDGHTLELKISNKTSLNPKVSEKRKKQKETKQKTTKILVRNIPFEAKRNELIELFKVFGEIKTVRLPKKLSGTGSHRGFGFVDFLTLNDAKRAFEALCHSTHLYGRRLVLEWANTEDDLEEFRKRTAENYDEAVGKKKKFTRSGLVKALEGSMAAEMGL